MSYARAAVVVAVWVLAAQFAAAQVSVEEAQKRLREKAAATGPATTQPLGELARVSEENRRLRLRIAQLEMEVSTLREALQHGGPATQASANAATQPVEPRVPVVGAWRGGDINRGSGYVLEFAADGTYRRTFLSYNKRETGQYRFTSGDMVEMWADTSPDGADHNAYRAAIESGQLTLTPTHANGADISNGRPLVLSRG